MPRELGLYWPRSDKALVIRICISCHRRSWECGRWDLEAKCVLLLTFSSAYVPARALPASRGALQELKKADRCFWTFMDCLICFTPPHGIGLLLRDDWQAIRKRTRGRGSCFEFFKAPCSVEAIPFHHRHLHFKYTLRNHLCLTLFKLSGQQNNLLFLFSGVPSLNTHALRHIKESHISIYPLSLPASYFLGYGDHWCPQQ